MKRYQAADSAYGDYLRQSNDGPYFLHALEFIKSNLDARANDDDRRIQSEHFNVLGRQIQGRFDDSVDNPRHFEKLKWFARHWNESTGNYRKFIPAVTGPGTNTFD